MDPEDPPPPLPEGEVPEPPITESSVRIIGPGDVIPEIVEP